MNIVRPDPLAAFSPDVTLSTIAESEVFEKRATCERFDVEFSRLTSSIVMSPWNGHSKSSSNIPGIRYRYTET